MTCPRAIKRLAMRSQANRAREVFKVRAIRLTIMMLILAVTCVSVSAQSRVAFKNNRLLVDGKPFFFLGADGVPDSLESMHRHHLNTVFGWGAAQKDAGQTGLMFIPYIHSPNARLEKVEQEINELKDDPALLAWNTGDDLDAKDLEKTRQVCETVRRLDPARPTMLDVLYNSKASYPSFASFTDMFCTYSYPLLWKEWTLPRYRQHLESVQELVGADKFCWTWVQVHTQFWYTHEVHGGPEEDHIPSLFPDAEHIRLLTYTAIQAGVKGILYYHHRFLRDDWYGKDRYAEVGILGCELQVLGPLIADGKVVAVAKTNQRDVHAVVIRCGKGLLVVLVKQGDRYQFQPDEGLSRNVKVRLPSLQTSKSQISNLKSQSVAACQIDFPQVRTLPVRQRDARFEFVIPKFELTTTVLLTDDKQFAASLKDRMTQLLPDAARFALQAVKGKREKVDPVLQQLGKLNVSLREQSRLLDRTHRLFDRSEELLKHADYADAYGAARDAQRLLRSMECRHWMAAVGNRQPADSKYLRCFYDLPQHYAYIRKLDLLTESEDLLSNGSFEQGDGTKAKDWSESVTAANREASGERTDHRSHTGKWSYHFTSRSMALWQGKKYDWVTADTTSTFVDVRPGEFVKLSAWVHVPQSIRDTQRGAILNLVGIDAAGKPVPGWKGMDIERRNLRGTSGWMLLSLVREVDDKRVVKVAARIGICGVGECYFDDVRLCRMRPKGQ